MDEKNETRRAVGPKQARPHDEQIRELLDPSRPKTEREHAAVREIERLRDVPVGGFDEWFDEYSKTTYTDEMLAEAAWKAALAQQPAPSVPVGVEAALSLLRAGHWREVHTGRRYMRLEVTYDYAAWERLMEQVEAALAQQPSVVPVGVAEAWQQGYHQGVLDERISEANIGIAGFAAKVEPARTNPYLAQQPAAVDEAMVFRMAVWMAKNDGHDDPHHLIWEGSPPEPWGEVWNRYEDDARAALTAALAAQPGGSDNDH